MVEFEMSEAKNVKILPFFEKTVVLRNSDIRAFITQFHGINIKPNTEFQLAKIYVGSVFEIFPWIYSLVKNYPEMKLHTGLTYLCQLLAESVLEAFCLQSLLMDI